MGLRNSYLHEFIPRNISLDSPEYKTRLLEKGLEIEVETIRPYLLPYEEMHEDDIEYRCTIDRRIFHRALEVLELFGLGAHHTNICSILKNSYVRLILAEIVNPEKCKFDAEYFKLFWLMKSENINEITFRTQLKDEKVAITSTHLLTAISTTIKRFVLKGPYIIGATSNGSGEKAIRRAKNAAIFDLVYYFMPVFQLFEPEEIDRFIVDPKIPNSLSRLCGNLLMITGVFGEELLGKGAGDEVKKMRAFIIQLVKNNEVLKAFLMGNFEPDYGTISDSFEDILY